jgi:hypothetical protein
MIRSMKMIWAMQAAMERIPLDLWRRLRTRLSSDSSAQTGTLLRIKI